MANIINPYRYVVSGGDSGGGDYVAITTSDATIVDEQFTYYDEDLGQNETISTGFKYMILDGTDAFSVTSKGTSSGSTTVDWLIIAGGGSGGQSGYYGGGGGAGGYREGTTTLTNTGSGSVSVGGGGAGSDGTQTDGNNSTLTFPSISTISATGGGHGGDQSGTAPSGGSGGGGAAGNSGGSGNDGSYSPPEGFSGGASPSSYSAGGGGGAGEAGNSNGQGSGGDGKWSAISAFTFTRRGGGGGAARAVSGGGPAGAGGGGSGNSFTYGDAATAGTAATGGGGGGGLSGTSYEPKSGGSGTVILRWQASASNYPLIALPSGTSFSNDTDNTDYLYAEFDSSDYFQVLHGGNSSGSDSIEAYVIGGGAGGGRSDASSMIGTGGGGGAGGFIRQTTFKNGDDLKGIYDVTIGAGGAQQAGGNDSQVVKQGERSISFDGSSYLVTGNNSDFTFGTGDFTVEFWVKPSQVADQWKAIIADDHYAATNYGWIIYQSYDDLQIWRSGSEILTKTDCFFTGKWMHIAWVRSSGTSTLYVNGVAEDTYSDSTNYNGDKIYIGQRANGSYDYEGNIYGVRVVNGSAVYTAAFNPSMEKLTAITNTKLLINPTTSQSTWTDSSASGHTLTGSGWSNFSSSLDSDTPLMRGFGGGKPSSYGGTSYPEGGGSGGGGGYHIAAHTAGGSGFKGQGNDGGDGGSSSPYSPFAGGGGAGSAGGDWLDGDGGDGETDSDGWMANNWLGPDGDGYFAGGGGGGGSTGGYGGSGGGGTGGSGSYDDGSSGSTNSGGGGGGGGKSNSYGASADGGSGGSGKVILRWKFRN